jgi:hypothetical protein
MNTFNKKAFIDRAFGWDTFPETTTAIADAAQKTKEKIQEIAANQDLQQEAMKDILKVLGISAALGIGGRALFGLPKFLNMQKKPRNLDVRSSFTTIPYPVVEQKKAEEKSFEKKADKSPWENLTKGWGDPSQVKDKSELYYYYPLMTLAAIGGLYGGWKLLDKVWNKYKETVQENELEEAKQRFHDALLMQYDKPIKKIPSINDLEKNFKVVQGEDDLLKKTGEELDYLFKLLEDKKLIKKVAHLMKRDLEAHEKKAEENGWFGRQANAGIDFTKSLFNQGLGLYGTYAVLTALIAGVIAYNRMSPRNDANLLAKAVAKKKRKTDLYHAAPLLAVPEAVKVVPRLSKKETLSILKNPDAEIG